MSPFLQVRAGAQRFLLPSSSVGRIGIAVPARGMRRVVDARRLDPARGDERPDEPVVIEWLRPPLIVLVDGVEGFVEPQPRDITGLPSAVAGLGSLFDAAWYDRENGRFLLRVRADAASPRAARRFIDLLRRLRPEQASAQ